MDDPKVCRACLSTKESFQYSLIENISADAYYFCTSVQIQDSEKLPRALCTPCYELLTLYTKFKQTCIDSQNTLLGCRQADTPSIVDDEPTTSVSDLDVKDDSAEAMVIYEAISDSDQSNGFEAESSSQESQEECCPSKEKKNKARTLSRAKKISLKRSHTYKALKTTRVSCDQCNLTFRKQDVLDTHKLKHEGETSYSCHKCMKCYATSAGLVRHYDSTHTSMSLSVLTCNECGRVCASRNALGEHVRAHRQVNAIFVCDACGDKFNSKNNMKAHMQTHNKDHRTHTCEQCTKQFHTQRGLKRHQRIHREQSNFICCLCDRSFTTKYSLTKHIHSIHELIKPYKCNIPSCGKSYATKESLQEHNRSHSGEKPYECMFCYKSFAARRRLYDHHRIHTGEKPHQCSVCKKSFTQRGTLQRHMKVHNKS